jgi:hypothetical protein
MDASTSLWILASCAIGAGRRLTLQGFDVHPSPLRFTCVVGRLTPLPGLTHRGGHAAFHASPIQPRRDDSVRAGVGSFTANKLRLPVVRFASGAEVIIERYTWTLNGASFRQLPLELGWALSIHKSQVSGLLHKPLAILPASCQPLLNPCRLRKAREGIFASLHALMHAQHVRACTFASP